MAIAGAAITAGPSAVEELEAGEVATILSEVRSSLKTAQDLFIATIVFSLFALMLGGSAHMGHGSNSTKYEVISHWTFEEGYTLSNEEYLPTFSCHDFYISKISGQ